MRLEGGCPKVDTCRETGESREVLGRQPPGPWTVAEAGGEGLCSGGLARTRRERGEGCTAPHLAGHLGGCPSSPSWESGTRSRLGKQEELGLGHAPFEVCSGEGSVALDPCMGLALRTGAGREAETEESPPSNNRKQCSAEHFQGGKTFAEKKPRI